MNDATLQRLELAEQRRKVDFDTYDVTVDELIRRVSRGRIDIAPVYQRQFRWDTARQSQLIESFLLGIPVPPLFMATTRLSDAVTQWEVVDGLQRLLSLVSFAGDNAARSAAKLIGQPLRLSPLDKLESLSGMRFQDLPVDIRTTLEDRPVKVIVLSDKSDLQVRFDLFERLNTGGVALTAQEVRECVFRGPFMDLLTQLATTEAFLNVVVLPDGSWKDGTPQDYTLRFFAFLECYKEFDHSVKDFLNTFVEKSAQNPASARRKKIFEATFNFLEKAFPTGLRSPKGTTTVNLFEAVAVGAALALTQNSRLKPPSETKWLRSKELRALTTGATNSRPRVKGRIEFCRDRFLNGS